MESRKAILWSGCAFLSSLRRTEGALSKEGPFLRGSRNRPALLPPAHTPSYVGQVWDIRGPLLGDLFTSSLQLQTCCPLLSLLPNISKGKRSQSEQQTGPPAGPPRSLEQKMGSLWGSGRPQRRPKSLLCWKGGRKRAGEASEGGRFHHSMYLWPDKLASPEGPLHTGGFPHLYSFPIYTVSASTK